VTTTARGAALLLLAATAVIYAGLTLPLQRKAAATADAYRRARDERREARSRLGEVQRRESALRRSAPAGGQAAASLGDPVARTRHGIVTALEGGGLSGVRLAVRPGGPPAPALVRLAAEGPFAEVVRLTAELVRPGTGLVLERYQLSESASRVAMRVEAVGLEAAR
jgi:hypothetical protein